MQSSTNMLDTQVLFFSFGKAYIVLWNSFLIEVVEMEVALKKWINNQKTIVQIYSQYLCTQ